MGPGLYIHIPFCKSKCRYCDFISFTGCEGRMEEYTAALLSEAGLWSDQFKDIAFDTVYIGGGTPSFLHEGLIITILDGITRRFAINPNAEISMEANPGTLSAGKLKEYRNAGINRLSMGLQSTNDEQLKGLGRIHTFNEFINGLDMARNAGFKNISIDLIYSLPGQTLTGWQQTLKDAILFNPEHISCYGLKIEEGTPFYTDYHAGKFVLPSEEETLEMIHTAQSILLDNGYMRYEISNYAKKGYECRHNIIYWDCGEYLGLGVAAHSCLRNDDGFLHRFENKKAFDGYISDIEGAVKPIKHTEKISHDAEMFEYIMLRLRLVEGIDYRQFSIRFKCDFTSLFCDRIAKLCSEGYAQNDSLHFYLTPKGLDVQNQIILYLMPN